ncbi:MAG: cytochrome c family protein [Pseudomonadota bacterium]
MGELGFTKISGAILATALSIMGLREVSAILFGHGGGHHGGHHDEDKSLNERISESYAYYVTVAEGGASADDVEPVFDLGLALANADVALGERSFRGKCLTCHTIEEGGATGTGPNMHSIVGAPKAQRAGFSYSSALAASGDVWTYEALNDWLENPAAYARGTTMAFAGLRRDDERANVIAYLAANTAAPPPFPDPAPAETSESEDAAEQPADPAE